MNSGTVDESTGRRSAADSRTCQPQRNDRAGAELHVVEREVPTGRRGWRSARRRWRVGLTWRRLVRSGLSWGRLVRRRLSRRRLRGLRHMRVERDQRIDRRLVVATLPLLAVERFAKRAVQLSFGAPLLECANLGLTLRHR